MSVYYLTLLGNQEDFQSKCVIKIDVIENITPGSFQVTANPSQGTRVHFIYYSFVTITTVGYGDILPVSLTARSLSMLEMVVGQIYLIVLIARLVGINISQSMGKKSKQ